MIFWTEALPKLSAFLTGLAVEGSDPLWAEQGAEWKQQAHSFVSPDAAVQIDLRVSSTSEGEYETRYEPYTDPGTGATTQRAVFTGFRGFVLNIQCKGYDADFAKWALVYAERIRTSISRNSVRDRLNELGFSFFRIGPIIDLDGVEDGHALSVNNLDLFGYVSFTDDLSTAEIAPMFTSITVTSKVYGYEDGVPPNFTDTISAPVIAPDPEP